MKDKIIKYNKEIMVEDKDIFRQIVNSEKNIKKGKIKELKY
ncbi:MAG: hypothetical protein Q8L29_03775 [archaeon]|nr:hypothetical protein [archaeon]